MEDGNGSDLGREEEEEDSAGELLRDRFRLSAISLVESEAKKNGMAISEPITGYISDLAFKFTEQLGKDVELFAQHGGRKCVNMEDVILCTHRNAYLTSLLRPLNNELRSKEPPQSERKRKKTSSKTKTKREDINSGSKDHNDNVAEHLSPGPDLTDH